LKPLSAPFLWLSQRWEKVRSALTQTAIRIAENHPKTSEERTGMKKWLGIALISMILATVTPASPLKAQSQPPNSKTVAEKTAPGVREIIYGVDPHFPPYTFARNGAPTGFEVELLQAMLQGASVKLTVRFMQWDAMLQALARGDIHVVSGVAKTEERIGRFAFSDQPSSSDAIRIFIMDAGGIRMLNDLGGKKVSVQRGVFFAERLAQVAGIDLQVFDTDVDALKALASRKVDAYVGNARPAHYNMKMLGLKKYRGYDIRGLDPPLFTTDSYFALPKDDRALLETINREHQRVLRDGTHGRLFRKWFVLEEYF
jgi:cystine transport system substrate-binding protein